MKTNLTVIAYIFAKPGEEQRVRAALLGLVEETRKEKGCINYDLHESEDNPAHFVMYENWRSAADLEEHARSAHLRDFGKNMGPFLERPTEITKWNMVSDLENAALNA
ncbi:MAG TPA: putative quinol monooxygenase [Candidatus Acidoferrales bacterium]|nr:putative quinol monooxygenase [Candidatus Acidoferrales bacterium]